MSLNIDLEDVPFAILEAVKARILANRRKLQDQQQRPRPSLRPRPQFAKIGATSKIWRLPKPAAMVEDESSGLIVVWNNGQPAIKDQNGVISDQFGYNYVPSTIDDLGGIPALSVSSFSPDGEAGYGNFFVTAKPNLETPSISSCTLEAWGELVALGGGPLNSRYAVDIRISWNYQPFTFNATSSVFCTYDFAPSGLSNPVSIPPYSRGSGAYFSCFCVPDATFNNKDEIFVSNSPPVGSFHVCIQIANYQVSYYLNGALMKRYPIASINIPTDELRVSVIPSSLGTSSSAKISEIRFTTDQARYPLDGFVPDRPPFP